MCRHREMHIEGNACTLNEMRTGGYQATFYIHRD